MAGRAAISPDNSRVYAQAADAALTLQRGLLPAELPKAAGLVTAARYLAGTDGLEAGGRPLRRHPAARRPGWPSAT